MHASTLRVVALEKAKEAEEAERAAACVSPAPLTFDGLFAMHTAFVWRSLLHFGVAEADLEDQIQEVFLVAYRRLAECDGEHPRAWLYAIARRCAAAYRRRSHRRHEHQFETLPESADPHDPTARAEVELLRRVFESLDEDKRAVFLLYEVEEMSMREVAEAVECPLQTAYTRLHAARRALARALERTT